MPLRHTVEALGHVGITTDLPDGVLHERLDDPPFYDVPAGPRAWPEQRRRFRPRRELTLAEARTPRSLPCRKVQGSGIGMDGVVALATTAKVANASATNVRIVALKEAQFIRSFSPASRQIRSTLYR